jgi:hypothetical protein
MIWLDLYLAGFAWLLHLVDIAPEMDFDGEVHI